MSKPDGGNAFPINPGNPGMSLRDYFAAAALSGFMGNARLNAEGADKNVPAICWLLADAMLAERDK